MNKKLLVAVCVFSCSLLAPSAFGEPTINVYTALAPNIFGSPSYSGWRDNAIYALEHGLSSYGTPGTP